MSVAMKNPSSQLMPVETQRMPGLLLSDSVNPIRIMGLKEAQQLSQFVPVIVLVPASSTDNIDPAQSTGNRSLGENLGTSKFLELFGKAVTQFKGTGSEGDLVFGDVKVSFSCMEASRKGEPVELTSLEFKTLKYLAKNARRVISRDELLNEVWGYENYPCTRTVDNQILKLRQKLERDPARPVHFRTVHGAGYKFLP
jgi:DNA-binding response OmpR family regulator